MSGDDNFAQRVAQQIEEDADEEWAQRASQIGIEVKPMAQIIAEEARGDRPTGTDGPRPVIQTDQGGSYRPTGRPRPVPIAPGRSRPQPIPPERQRMDRVAAAVENSARAAGVKRQKRREYRIVQEREPVDIWVEPTEEELQRDPSTPPELITVYVRRTPATELPYLDRYEAMLIRLRHRMTDLKVDGPKSQTRLDTMAGEYNALMEEMIMFSVDMPEGTYARLDSGALGYLQNVVRELARPADEEDEQSGNW